MLSVDTGLLHCRTGCVKTGLIRRAQLFATQSCVACCHTGQPGDRLNCYDHCIKLTKADPDERFIQVLKQSDCTICLVRDHNSDVHLTRAEGKKTCGLCEKSSGTVCVSTQIAFHGFSGQKHNTQRNLHTRELTKDAKAIKDTSLV